MLAPNYTSYLFLQLSLSAHKFKDVHFDIQEHKYINHARNRYQQQIHNINAKISDINRLRGDLRRHATTHEQLAVIVSIEEELKTAIQLFNDLRKTNDYSADEMDRIETLMRHIAETLYKKKQQFS